MIQPRPTNNLDNVSLILIWRKKYPILHRPYVVLALNAIESISRA